MARSKAKSEDYQSFVKQVRSSLWRHDGGSKIEYNRWGALVKRLASRGPYTEQEAVIEASKDFPLLHRLFREFDVKADDLHLGSNPRIHHLVDIQAERLNGENLTHPDIQCDERETSYKDQIEWALARAGEHAATGREPDFCPNWGSYYLYVQARDNNKEFMSRLGQIQTKREEDSDEKKLNKKNTKRSIDEINEMLDSLDSEEGA